MRTNRTKRGRSSIWMLALLLGLLHHDFWFWSDRTLIFGFLPAGMGYHMLFSLLSAALWLLALRIAWPGELEAWADEPPDGPPRGGEKE